MLLFVFVDGRTVGDAVGERGRLVQRLTMLAAERRVVAGLARGGAALCDGPDYVSLLVACGC